VLVELELLRVFFFLEALTRVEVIGLFFVGLVDEGPGVGPLALLSVDGMLF
jgi:hypothetical protein